ncbi:hypothetical protein QTQ03_28995 [Micromonospora sp. WMMA1363]|uniref:hypothetical protein n=1 Tax=Micromonospora sp. WMMA1363 TaxID=3053985 RepID=UPI00259C9EBE|nr:hypothetical protein [Micromonospora sp. WMMA1363]MDM4723427.1 hypothetical protein [Micromonospora sp. WMMA1363]
MKKIPGLAGRVRVGAPDASLTPVSGVVAVAELVGRLGVTAALDDAVGRIKQRDRGLSAESSWSRWRRRRCAARSLGGSGSPPRRYGG